MSKPPKAGMVRVRGARQHNLKDVDVDLPRDALVVFTGVSGSGKSSLAFGTLYAEAQRRYLESVAPFARRLFDQMEVPQVDEIEGLPPAVALQQQRGSPGARSSVGSVTTLGNLLRMLYARAGDYPRGQAPLAAEAFSANTPAGACPDCRGQGRLYVATEASMVPDPGRTVRERAVAAWPPAWHGQNLRDILTTLGHDVDVPWRRLPRRTRDWILFTDEQPAVPVYPGYSVAEVRAARRRGEPPSYQGTFSSARRHLLHTLATTQSASLRQRALRYLTATPCAGCGGRRLQPAALAVKLAGRDFAATAALPLDDLAAALRQLLAAAAAATAAPEKAVVRQRIGADMLARIEVAQALGLGYLSLSRATPGLSPGELQRLRLATQVRANLFGVVYVLDEPSAGLHPADTEALLAALRRLRAAGNSLFVVEHDLDVIRQADWLVDVGPQAGAAGGQVLYSGPPAGLRDVAASQTRPYLFAPPPPPAAPPAAPPRAWLRLEQVRRHNLEGLDVALPRGALTCVTGVSGSGKSSLVSQALVQLMAEHLGQATAPAGPDGAPDVEGGADADADAAPDDGVGGGRLAGGTEGIRRLVEVDQRPIGRTPRSNLATYTGLFDHVRRAFAATPAARRRRLDAGHFSFNVAKGRCARCEGAGAVAVELLFLASVYAPCPACHGARYAAATLAVHLAGLSIADVLGLSVEAAADFFAALPPVRRACEVLQQVGLGYLRLGQPATELSGGEAQRIKLATELQRPQRGDTLYVLDEPTTGLHPSDVERLRGQLRALVEAGNTVVVVEHDMQLVAAADWVVDMGPGAGAAGGQVVAAGPPAAVAAAAGSRTAPYLRRALGMAPP